MWNEILFNCFQLISSQSSYVLVEYLLKDPSLLRQYDIIDKSHGMIPTPNTTPQSKGSKTLRYFNNCKICIQIIRKLIWVWLHYTAFFFFLTLIYCISHHTNCSSPSLRSPSSNLENLQDPLQSQLRFLSCPPSVAMIQQPMFDMLRCIFAKYVRRFVHNFFSIISIFVSYWSGYWFHFFIKL